jgi:hypothetical protein
VLTLGKVSLFYILYVYCPQLLSINHSKESQPHFLNMADDQTFSTSETTGTADRKRRTILIGAIFLLICAIVAIVLGVLLSREGNTGSASSIGSTNDKGGIVTSPPTSVMLPVSAAPSVANATVVPSSSAGDVVTSAPVVVGVGVTTAPIAAGTTTAPLAAGVTTVPITTAPITTAPASVGTTAPAFAPIPPSSTTAPIADSASASPAATIIATTAAPTTDRSINATNPAVTNPAVEAVIKSVALKGGAEFEDPASYQSKALAFVSAGSGDYTDEQLIQRYALASVHYATNAVITPCKLLDLAVITFETHHMLMLCEFLATTHSLQLCLWDQCYSTMDKYYQLGDRHGCMHLVWYYLQC